MRGNEIRWLFAMASTRMAAFAVLALMSACSAEVRGERGERKDENDDDRTHVSSFQPCPPVCHGGVASAKGVGLGCLVESFLSAAARFLPPPSLPC